MNLSFSTEDIEFQKEVSAWLEDNWSEDLRRKQAHSAMKRLSKDDLVLWQKRLAKKGLGRTKLARGVWGADFSPNQNYIFDLERAKVGAPGVVLLV